MCDLCELVGVPSASARPSSRMGSIELALCPPCLCQITCSSGPLACLVHVGHVSTHHVFQQSVAVKVTTPCPKPCLP
eukprot:811771-Amphidinium_carterae.1